jgi:hypothetical protein
MFNYDVLKEYRKRPPEERLSALRNELLMQITLIRGYTTLMKKEVDYKTATGLPEDFEEWIDAVARAGGKLYHVLEAITGRDE